MCNISSESTKSFKRVYKHIGAAISDNGPAFASEQFREFVLRNAIKHMKTVLYHPSNRAAENAVCTLKKKYKVLLKDNAR